ncbi:MAG: hypothetical protein P8M16_05755 [Acidimicrobiales bacterium]|nr:hypothetical protein [Acidimicrobiales bacterium]
MSEPVLNVEAMLKRFQERAAAVRSRTLPPVGGEERQRFINQAQDDLIDFGIVGDAEATFTDGILTLRIDLRPQPALHPDD